MYVRFLVCLTFVLLVITGRRRLGQEEGTLPEPGDNILPKDMLQAQHINEAVAHIMAIFLTV